MGYVGNQTTTAFTSMAKQDITGDGGTGYTLDHAVANAQEIEVFVNNVRQEPGTAYTVSGTTLTMTGNVASTDDFYVVYQGKAIQTSVPGDNTVTTAMLQDSSVATAKIADTAVTAGKLATSLDMQNITLKGGTNNAITVDSSGIVDLPNTKIYALFRNTTNVTSGGNITAWEVPDTGITAANIGDTFTHSSGVWTFPRTGVYRVIGNAGVRNTSGDSLTAAVLQTTSDSGSNYVTIAYQACGSNDTTNEDGNLYLEVLVNITNTTTQKIQMGATSVGGSSIVYGDSTYNRTTISFEWMAPAQ